MSIGNSLNKQSELPELNDEVIRVKKMPAIHDGLENIPTNNFEEDTEIEENQSWEEIPGNVTHQYLKFVNAHLAERLNLAEKLEQIKNNLEREIELLKSDELTRLIKIPNMSINDLSASEINEVDTYMKLQRGLTKSKVDYYKNKLENAKTELEENQMQINELDEKNLESDNSQKVNTSESDDMVKDELEFLIKKYGMKELTYAIDVITSSKMIRNNRELQ